MRADGGRCSDAAPMFCICRQSTLTEQPVSSCKCRVTEPSLRSITCRQNVYCVITGQHYTCLLSRGYVVAQGSVPESQRVVRRARGLAPAKAAPTLTRGTLAAARRPLCPPTGLAEQMGATWLLVSPDHSLLWMAHLSIHRLPGWMH